MLTEHAGVHTVILDYHGTHGASSSSSRGMGRGGRREGGRSMEEGLGRRGGWRREAGVGACTIRVKCLSSGVAGGGGARTIRGKVFVRFGRLLFVFFCKLQKKTLPLMWQSD